MEKQEKNTKKSDQPGCIPSLMQFLSTVLLTPASLLTLIVPGLGHLLTAKPLKGLFWFIAVEGSFILGYAILGIRFFGGGLNLGTVMMGLPLNYVPEVGNFLATFLLVRSFPAMGSPQWMDAVSLAKLPVSMEHIGFLLTALSGILNLFAAADAWWIAKHPQTLDKKINTPSISALLSWLVPGLGQWKLGYKWKGIFYFVSLTALYLLGLIFSNFTAVDRSQVYYWYAGMILNGGATIISTIFFAPLPFTNTNSLMWDLGVTTTCVAGLFNVVVILEAYTLSEKILLGEKK